MFERFTERARKVISLARQEAQRLQSEHIDTEHLLLAILQEGEGVGARVLKLSDQSYAGIRLAIERERAPLPLREPILGQLPFSPSCTRVIQLAGEAASQLENDTIGTEHLLIGLLREEAGIAGRMLAARGVQLEEVLRRILKLQLQGPKGTSPHPVQLDDASVHLWARTYPALEDRPSLQASIADLLRQGRSIALVGPKRVGKTSVVLAMSRARTGGFTYWLIDHRMFDPLHARELATIGRLGSVCFVPEGELLTASRSVDAGLLQQRQEGGERLMLEFREGGLEQFAGRYPHLAKDLVPIDVKAPDGAECRQLLEASRRRLTRETGIKVSDGLLQEADRTARERWPQIVPPWGALALLRRAEAIHSSEAARGDLDQLERDIRSLQESGDPEQLRHAELLKAHVEGLRGIAGLDLTIESLRQAAAELSESGKTP